MCNILGENSNRRATARIPKVKNTRYQNSTGIARSMEINVAREKELGSEHASAFEKDMRRAYNCMDFRLRPWLNDSIKYHNRQFQDRCFPLSFHRMIPNPVAVVENSNIS